MLRNVLQSRVLVLLSSVRVGIVTGFFGAALLALSSLFIPDPRGEGRLPFSESLAHFFEPARAQWWWLYALIALFAFFGLGVLASTLRTALLRPRAQWDMRFAGVVLMHAAFLGGLLTHLLAGLSSEVEDFGRVGQGASRVGGHAFELLDQRLGHNPDGSLRSVRASVSVDGGAPRTLGYNDPIFLDGFKRFVLLQQLDEEPDAPVFRVDGQTVPVRPGQTFGVGPTRYRLDRVSHSPTLRAPMAQLSPVDGGEPRWVALGWDVDEAVRFVGFTSRPVLLVAVQRNDGLPLLFISSLVFVLGLGLFLWGRGRRRATRSRPADRPRP